MKDPDSIYSKACSSCGGVFRMESLHLLPEEEEYARGLSRAVLHGSPSPDPPEDSALRAKYGFGLGSLFCDGCYEKLRQISSPANKD